MLRRLTPENRRLVGGLVGSVLVLVGGLVTADLPPGPMLWLAQPLQILGATRPGRAVGLVAIIAGMGLLARYWVSLVLMPHGRSVEVRLRETRRTIAVWCAPLLLAPPLFSLDGWSYVAQGAMTQAGYDPYTQGPASYQSVLTLMVAPLWRFTPTPYGPLPIAWGAWCAELVHDPTILLLAERIPVVVGMVLVAWSIPRLAQPLGVDPAMATALALGSPFVLAHAVGGLHNDAFVMGVVTAALVLAQRGRWPVAMMLVGAAAAVKITAGVAAVPVLLLSLPVAAAWWNRLTRLVLGALVAGAVVIACGLPYGLGLGWLNALSVPGVLVTPTSVPTALGMGLDHVLRAQGLLGAADMAVPLARSIGMALALAIVVVTALVRPTGELRSALGTMVGVMTVVIVLSPVVHTWYPLVVVPMLALVTTRGRGRPFVLVTGGLLGLTAPLDSSMAGAPLAIAAVVGAVMVLAGLHIVHVHDHPTDTV